MNQYVTDKDYDDGQRPLEIQKSYSYRMLVETTVYLTYRSFLNKRSRPTFASPSADLRAGPKMANQDSESEGESGFRIIRGWARLTLAWPSLCGFVFAKGGQLFSLPFADSESVPSRWARGLRN